MNYEPKYAAGPFKALRERLYAKPIQRITPKSAFLLHVEKVQAQAKRKASAPKQQPSKRQAHLQALAAIKPTDEDTNRSRRVVSLTTAYARRRG